MKKLFTLLLFMLAIATDMLQAQTKVPLPNSIPSPNVQTGQMLDTANTYVGSRLDTVSNTTTKYFYVCKIKSTGLPGVYPLYGSGRISFTITGVKISGTPAGTVTLEESYDGVYWAPVRNTGIPTISTVSTDTTGVIYTSDATYTYTNPDIYTIRNVATVQSYTYDLPVKYGTFYRMRFDPTGTSTSSWRVFYQWIRD